MEGIINQFHFKGSFQNIKKIEKGLINSSFVVEYLLENKTKKKYILQKINSSVFKNIEELMENVKIITNHLKVQNINTLNIIPTHQDKIFLSYDNEYWRAFDFIENSYVHDKARNINLVEETGKAIAKFHKAFYGFPSELLYTTIPHFHDTHFIYNQFKKILISADNNLKEECYKEIDYILSNTIRYNKIQNLKINGKLPERVCHNDTKISNILFDKKEKSICMIDLDTVMSGTIITDFSDSIRTTCVTQDENESNLSKVNFRINYFKKFTEGYLSINGENLNSYEINNLVFAVELIFIEQGIRFLSDYLNGNTYYKITYEKQNLVRARNQLHLSKQVERNIEKMQSVIKNYLN